MPSRCVISTSILRDWMPPGWMACCGGGEGTAASGCVSSLALAFLLVLSRLVPALVSLMAFFLMTARLIVSGPLRLNGSRVAFGSSTKPGSKAVRAASSAPSGRSMTATCVSGCTGFATLDPGTASRIDETAACTCSEVASRLREATMN